jgi:hypothetical protein
MPKISFKPKQVTKRILSPLQDRAYDVLVNRFGLGDTDERKTLEAIGDTYGITRERVRQIESAALAAIRKSEDYKTEQPIFAELKDIVQKLGSLVSEDELLAAKSYALGRYQMGAQTVAQISNFYTNRYFADGVVKDYEKVPDAIRKTSRDLMISTAQSFIAHNTWALAGVSSGSKETIVDLSDKLDTLFHHE